MTAAAEYARAFRVKRLILGACAIVIVLMSCAGCHFHGYASRCPAGTHLTGIVMPAGIPVCKANHHHHHKGHR